MVEESTVFGTQKKQRYGLLNNIIYNFKAEREWDKKMFVFQWLIILPNVAAAFLGTLLPTEVVRGLEEGWPPGQLAGRIALLAILMWLCHAADKSIEQYLRYSGMTLSHYYIKKCARKMLYMDYEVIEGIQSLTGNTWKAVRNEDNFIYSVSSVSGVIEGILALVFYGILIGQQNLWLLPALVLSSVIRCYLLKLVKHKHGSYHSRLSGCAKQAAYLYRQSIESAAGKDIRIYQMADWFIGKNRAALMGMDEVFQVIHNWYFFGHVCGAVLNFGVNLFAWIWLLQQAADGKISITVLVFTIGLVNGFLAYFTQTFRRVMELNPFCTAISYIRDFLAVPNRWKEKEGVGTAVMEEIRKSGVKLELKNVSFRYHESREPVVSGINLVIRPGERLALLGLNGAGKTTLVKLICGFYQPDEGEILINDIPMERFSREEYFSLVSVLFQDSTMLPVTLDENLTGVKEMADRVRLREALQLSGFAEKYDSLKEKGNTMLIRELNDAAVDFSGGEKQKLIFARGLYKKAPLLILDEPTAALDPIAENALYQKLGEAVKGRTCIYISHRLSSTRFCDRIILLEHGRVLEEGTHESLMAGNTRYAQFFEIQSRYYREEERRRRQEEIMGDTYVESEEERRSVFHE